MDRMPIFIELQAWRGTHIVHLSRKLFTQLPHTPENLPYFSKSAREGVCENLFGNKFNFSLALNEDILSTDFVQEIRSQEIKRKGRHSFYF